MLLLLRYYLVATLLLFGVTLCAKSVDLPTHIIAFHGQQAFDESQLQEAMGVDTKQFFEFWKEDTPRIKDKLLPTLEESLGSFYDSEGFYDASFHIEESNTTVAVTIDEKLPVLVGDINITTDFNLSGLVTFKRGEIFQARRFIAIKNQIISALLKRGYCSYELDTKAFVDLVKHRVDLRYTLRKDGICTFGKLTLSGLTSIDRAVIRSRVRALEGEPFSQERVQETSNSLYQLKAFDSVIINVDRKFYNVIPVDITFRERAKPYHFEIGVGYDTYVGKRIHAKLTKYNFWGDARRLGVEGGWSQKEQHFMLSYYQPTFFTLRGYYLDLGAKVGYSNLEFEGFREEKSFSRLYGAYTDGKLRVEGGVALEHIVINGVDNIEEGVILKQAVSEGIFSLFYPYLTLTYDARDSKLNPKKGYYLSLYHEMGLSHDEESSLYTKSILEGRVIYTLADLTFAVVGKMGSIANESAMGLPESKYFFGGGSYSNRAYGYNELGVLRSSTDDSNYGASSMLNLSVEADYPIVGELYGAVFMDKTLLNEASADFSGEMITSAGVGVRYMTPIGPFKLDVGFNVDDTSHYGIQFQIGQSF